MSKSNVQNTKESLKKAIESVRNKHKIIKLSRSSENENLNKVFKPITESLDMIKKKIPEINVKQEPQPKEKIYGRKGHETKVKFFRNLPLEQVIKKDVPVNEEYESMGEMTKTFSENDNDDNKQEPIDSDNDEVFSETMQGEYDPERSRHEDIAATALEDYLSSYSPVVQDYIRGYLLNYPNFDKTSYGLRHDLDTDKWFLGNKEIKFIDNDQVVIGDQIFDGTVGLYEELFKSEPQNIKITKNDVLTYGQIIQLTSVNRQDFNSMENLRGTRYPKYTQYIKVAYDTYLNDLRKSRHISAAEEVKKLKKSSVKTPEQTDVITKPKRQPIKSGFGNTLNLYNNKPFQYVYFDDVNELVTRLALLHASIKAGNMSHLNEVHSIEEELRELGVIY